MTETASILRRIAELKAERNAVLLAHNYQVPEVQDAADFVGDSLELSRKAAALRNDVIVFCGVRFMAETAAVLSPGRRVLLPDPDAGCPMADMITAPQLRAWKARWPGRKVVCYVNTSAEVKAESDVCCTSANAVAVVKSLGVDEVLFVPDRNLADFVAQRSGVRVIAWDGCCYVHDKIRPEDVAEKRAAFPGAEVWAHPECRIEVTALADRVLSTGQMVAAARTSTAADVVLATEPGMVHRLVKENPAIRYHPAREQLFCFNMKKITLPKVLRALETGEPRVVVPAEVADRARGAIEAMLRVTG